MHEAEISILNLTGQKVYMQKLTGIVSGNEININVQNLEKGIYILQCKTLDYTTSMKIKLE
ncbi:MAG: T9SS type A sorting domain-containing protein [Bacteroidales bacterium]|nr:T9SS type A sorting domain-containing protein [Bacteroidales bacterium]